MRIERQRSAARDQDRLAPLTGSDPLGDPVDEQVRDVILGQIAALEGLVILAGREAPFHHPRPWQEKINNELTKAGTPT
jgi:hypothetical protein